jgi:hypothetical protein
MPCHEQIDYSDPDWQKTQMPHVDLCAGMLIYYKNHLKGPRRPVLYDAVKAIRMSAAVFSHPIEFFRHHMPLATEVEIAEAVRKATWPYLEESE